MHFISELRYNARIQGDDWYYRIKESFRDRTGRARCRIMLNVGFMDEAHRPEDIRDIGKCLNHLHRHRGEIDMFGGPLFINITAMSRGVNLKDMPILESLGYVFVPLLS